jgi:L-fucose isomerase-like protein
MKMPNTPDVKLAIVGVSRDCFPIKLTQKRLAALVAACKKAGLKIFSCPTIIENEKGALAAIDECQQAGAKAAVIYLGNFGPEGPLAIFAQRFGGPVMACAASEEETKALMGARGDAFCGLLNASYNFGLRKTPVYIPQMPVGLPEDLAAKIAHFADVARIVIGVKNAKIFSFGPRPYDFFACNAPIKPLYDLGVEVMENSELDLLQLFEKVKDDEREVKATVRDMVKELAGNEIRTDVITLFARLEVCLKRFAAANLGSRDYAIYANKCWPAFHEAFTIMPCYVNSRMAKQGIPAACEVDIYGGLSEYMCQLASRHEVTLLDINNSVPDDMAKKIKNLQGAKVEDLFMGFHCGNTPSSCMKTCTICYLFAMDRTPENQLPGMEFKRGTLEGQIMPGPVTIFRLQGNADSELTSYVAQGNVLDVDPQTFGGTGVMALPNFARFYRHVVIGKQFPHHTAVGFAHIGKALFDATQLLGVKDINMPLPEGVLYPGENPF